MVATAPAWASEPVASTVAPAAGTVTVSVSGSYDPTAAEALLNTLNTTRAKALGEDTALVWSSSLASTAQQRAAECSLLCEGTRPNGEAAPALEARAQGTGSNLAAIIASWLSSDSSAYKAITDASVSAVGISAFTASDGTVYVVAEFGAADGASGSPLQGDQVVAVPVSTAGITLNLAATGLEGLQPTGTAQLSYSAVYGTVPLTLTSASWTSSNPEIASVAADSGAITAVAPGSATMTLSSDGVTLGGITITVDTPTAVSATVEPAAVETPYGVAPELPATASVTFSNQTTQDVQIAWNPLDESAYHIGGNTFAATGTADDLPVSVEVTVGSPAIESVANPEPITIVRGETPELPNEVTVTLEDGTTETLPVAWQLPAEGEPAPWETDAAQVDITGTVEGVDTPVTQTVLIEDAPAEDETTAPDDATNGITEDSEEAVDSTTAPEDNPEDGEAADPQPSPDADDANTDATPEEPAEPNDSDAANGETTDPSDVTDDATDPDAPAEDETPDASGDASDDPSDEESNDNADDGGADAPELPSVQAFVNPPTYYALEGSRYELPTSIEATLPDGTQGTVEVTWQLPEDAKPSDEGALVATCDLSVEDPDGGEPTTEQATQTIQLLTVAKNEISLTVAQDADVTLPATVTMAYNDLSVEVPVAWDSVPEDATAEPGTLTVTGTVNGTVGEITATVTVEEAAPAIIAVTDPASVSTQVGVAPELPSTVQVTYDDETTGEAEVAWDEIPAERYAAPGSFLVEGTVANSDLKATVKVTVVETAGVIKSIETPTVETAAGTAPQLPETVEVTWDNDTVSNEKVTWAPIAADQYAKAGSFTVAGTIEALENAKTSCTVKVVSIPVSVQDFPDVTTDAGIAPVLPSSAVVTYSDGSTVSEAVTWNAIDPASYHNQGTFTVEGAVANTELTARIQVVVAAPKVAAIQNNLAVQTKVGVAPQLPSTASVRWSNGDTTDEPVTWNQPSADQYAKAGSFTATGTVVGYNVSCAVTVVQPAPQVVATGDTTSMVPVVVGVVAGMVIVGAAIALILRGRKK